MGQASYFLTRSGQHLVACWPPQRCSCGFPSLLTQVDAISHSLLKWQEIDSPFFPAALLWQHSKQPLGQRTTRASRNANGSAIASDCVLNTTCTFFPISSRCAIVLLFKHPPDPSLSSSSPLLHRQLLVGLSP